MAWRRNEHAATMQASDIPVSRLSRYLSLAAMRSCGNLPVAGILLIGAVKERFSESQPVDKIDA
jgi:hypothetical protein